MPPDDCFWYYTTAYGTMETVRYNEISGIIEEGYILLAHFLLTPNKYRLRIQGFSTPTIGTLFSSEQPLIACN